MSSFYSSLHCRSRIHCETCRNDRQWRYALTKLYDDIRDNPDFPCPREAKDIVPEAYYLVEVEDWVGSDSCGSGKASISTYTMLGQIILDYGGWEECFRYGSGALMIRYKAGPFNTYEESQTSKG